MKRLFATAAALTALVWVGCGGDDDEPPPPVDRTIIVTADTTTAPAIPLTVDDAAWGSVEAVTIPLSTATPLPSAPARSPLGPSMASAAPSEVEVQAIRKGGHLFFRLQWNDATLSMQRENWELFDKNDFNFNHRTDRGEDQAVVLFEGAPGGWDMWNWRILTTGQMGRAEDATLSAGEVVLDAGVNEVATANATNDPFSPPWFHTDQWLFTGDVFLFSDRTVPRSQAVLQKSNWELGQTVPGWWINDNIDWSSITESRWDIYAAYDYDAEADQYTLVLVRDLSAGEEDLDMSGETRVNTRIGILDNAISFSAGTSQRAFSATFYLDLPH